MKKRYFVFDASSIPHMTPSKKIRARSLYILFSYFLKFDLLRVRFLKTLCLCQVEDVPTVALELDRPLQRCF